MPIVFRCPKCEKGYRVGDEYAGRRSKCRGCGELMTVPAASEFAVAPQAAAQDAKVGAGVAAMPPKIKAPTVPPPLLPPSVPDAVFTHDRPLPTAVSEQVACPHCGSCIENDGLLSGQQVACPSCHLNFTMPRPGMPATLPLSYVAPRAVMPMGSFPPLPAVRISKAFYGHSYALGLFGGITLTLVGIILIAMSAGSGMTFPWVAASLIAAGIGGHIYANVIALVVLYRMWDSIQGGQAQTTAGKAVGFMFIPLFNLYWIFVACPGWVNDYNITAEQRGLAVPKLGTGVAMTACILMLAGAVIPFASIGALICFTIFIYQACGAINALATAQGNDEPPKVSPAAAGSVLLGSLGWVSAGFLGIPGLLLGIMGLRAAKRNQKHIDGKPLAMTGTIVSACSLIMLLVVFAVVLPIVSSARSSIHQTTSMGNVRQLNQVALMYAADHKGRLPSGGEFTTWAASYSDPGSLKEFSQSPSAPGVPRAYSMNALVTNGKLSNVGSDTVLFFDSAAGSPAAGGPGNLPAPARQKNGHIVGFTDGHVEIVADATVSTLKWLPTRLRTCPKCQANVQVARTWTPANALKCQQCGQIIWTPGIGAASGDDLAFRPMGTFTTTAENGSGELLGVVMDVDLSSPSASSNTNPIVPARFELFDAHDNSSHGTAKYIYLPLRSGGYKLAKQYAPTSSAGRQKIAVCWKAADGWTGPWNIGIDSGSPIPVPEDRFVYEDLAGMLDLADSDSGPASGSRPPVKTPVPGKPTTAKPPTTSVAPPAIPVAPPVPPNPDPATTPPPPTDPATPAPPTDPATTEPAPEPAKPLVVKPAVKPRPTPADDAKAAAMEAQAMAAEGLSETKQAIGIYEDLIKTYPEFAARKNIEARLKKLKASPEIVAEEREKAAEPFCRPKMKLAENYIRIRRFDKAKEPLQLIIDKYPDTTWATKAQEMLDRLDK